jgi:hypothetical protein
VKRIQFSYSNEDIKDEEEEVGLMAAWNFCLTKLKGQLRTVVSSEQALMTHLCTDCIEAAEAQLRCAIILVDKMGLEMEPKAGFRPRLNLDGCRLRGCSAAA